VLPAGRSHIMSFLAKLKISARRQRKADRMVRSNGGGRPWSNSDGKTPCATAGAQELTPFLSQCIERTVASLRVATGDDINEQAQCFPLY
jgi:hypothetical protein